MAAKLHENGKRKDFYSEKPSISDDLLFLHPKIKKI
jgi:hypothetical protein